MSLVDNILTANQKYPLDWISLICSLYFVYCSYNPEKVYTSSTSNRDVKGGCRWLLHWNKSCLGRGNYYDHRWTRRIIMIEFSMAFHPDFVIPTKGESLLTAYSRWRGWADEKVSFRWWSSFALSPGVLRLQPSHGGDPLGAPGGGGDGEGHQPWGGRHRNFSCHDEKCLRASLKG